jgi:hypothetical protein
MVQADISQLSRECNTWINTLRTQRDEFNQCKQNLQELASHPLSKEDLTEVEHYHNQFHIQLINIHDLKHAIKTNDRKAGFEKESHEGQLEEDTFQTHENLHEEYERLQHHLEELREDFKKFLSRTK